MPPDTEVAGLSVVVSAEVAQAMKVLEGMSKQFEDTAVAAQHASDIQDASFTKTGKGMDDDLKQHKKHSAGVMAALKKIGMAWTAITGAATAGIYGLLRASSYGSLYFGQWGAITKDVANTAIRPLIPTLNDVTNEFKKLADILKQEGTWGALKTGISDAITWFGNLDWKMQVLVATIGILMGATAIAGIIAILPTLSIAVGAVIAVLTGPVGFVLAIGAVILIMGSWWSKTKEGTKTIGDLKTAWQKFKDSVKDDGYADAAKTSLSDFIDWIFSPEQWVIKDSPLDNFLKFFTKKIPDAVANMITLIGGITWPDITNPFSIDYLEGVADWVLSLLGLGDYTWDITWPHIDNPFAGVKWCSIIPGWVASVLGICDDTAVAPVVTWPGIPDPFANVFDTITDFAGGAADVGGTLIDNLVSGINTGMPSLSDAVSGITDTLSGIGGGGGTGTGGSGNGSGDTGGYWVQNNDLSMAEKNSLAEQYMNGDITQDEYFNATHTWVPGSSNTDNGETSPDEVPPIPVGTITRVGPYNNYHGGLGWSADWINDEGTNEYLGYVIGELYDLIGGKNVLQSVFDTEMNEQQQQNWMDSHGAIIDDTTHEITQQYAKGGYVPSTSAALVHEGEYVVPRSGALIKEGGIPDITINLTVNNGTQKDSRMLADEISRLLSAEIRRLVKT